MTRALHQVASLRWTPVLLVLIGLGVMATTLKVASPTLWLMVPFSLLAINLLAAIFMNPRFRTRSGLLIFHVALLSILLLIGISRLTYLKGWAEITEGTEFHGILGDVQKGPFHFGKLEEVRFLNKGFSTYYGPKLRRQETRNQISWIDDNGLPKQKVIGDNTSLSLHGYQFSTSSNRGFTLFFVWIPTVGTPETGTLHLPSYPRRPGQSVAWTLPGTDIPVLAMLLLEETLETLAEKSWVFPGTPSHQVRVTLKGESHDIKLGDTIQMQEGTLMYQRLGSWMGYRVFSDWTRPWLLSAFLVGIFGLIHHFWIQFTTTQTMKKTPHDT